MTVVNLEKGNLRENPAPYLLKTIADGKHTGMMVFQLNDQQKQMYFNQGKTIAAESTSPHEQLAEVMFNGGVFDQITLEKVKLLILKGGWQTPQIEQIVDIQTQKWWMRTVLREVFLSLIEWDGGEYEFSPKKIPPSFFVMVEMDTERLLFSILRRVRDINQLVRILGGSNTVLTIDSSGLGSKAARLITAQDGFFLSRIDGQMSLHSILSMAGGQKMEMARFYIFAILNGLLKFSETEKIQKSKPVKVLSEEEIESLLGSPAEETKKEEEEVEPRKDPDTDEFSLDVRLTTDELKALRELAGSMNSDFLDLSKNIDFDRPQEKGNVAYDAKISYLRGGQYIEVDSSDSAYDIDALGRIGSSENFAEDMLNERIALIIDGKEVD
ncbi:DUF4388 domain-containing protein, partial [bacterium]|nr:DUF4388 domain-containing protein [bacterium]